MKTAFFRKNKINSKTNIPQRETVFLNLCGGFTLIEMLVVVAIIGILSSVLLTALGPAKDRAKDSRILEEVNQVRNIAETLYDGDYNALERIPAGIIRNRDLTGLAEDITNQGGELHVQISSNGLNYAAYSKLNSKVGPADNPKINFYCVDSTGHSGFTTDDLSGRNNCPR